MIRTLLLAAALAVAAVTPSWSGAAGPPVPPVPPAMSPPHAPPLPGPGAGPWVTGGMMVSAFSLIVCGVWECNATHNEMSKEEAAPQSFPSAASGGDINSAKTTGRPAAAIASREAWPAVFKRRLRPHST